jgi:low affinity Fe/Cu permease
LRQRKAASLSTEQNSPATVSSSFNVAAQWTARQCGRPTTFVLACLVVVVWALTGPLFKYSDTWQLVINTGTTVVTFLMVFLIQNTQNRDSAILHLKLDELIRATDAARNKLLNLEDLSDTELEHLKTSFTRLAADPANTLLREAADELEIAGKNLEALGDDIRDERDKLASDEITKQR